MRAAASTAIARQPYRYQPDVQWDPQVWQYLCQGFGEAGMQAMAAKLASPPLNLCFRINTLRISPNDALRELQQQICSREGWSALEVSPLAELPNVVVLKGHGPHAVDTTSAQDASGAGTKQVVVDRKCGEAVLRGAAVYAPGVLGCSPNVQEGDSVAVLIALSPQMTRGTVLGSQHDAPSEQATVFIGVGRTAMGRSEMFRKSRGLAVEMTQPVFAIPSGAGLLPGQVMLQNLPSIVAAAVLAPPPGACVLDMCAAPGGKTTAMAEQMGDAGQIIALDRTHEKAGTIRDLAEELGLSCIQAYKMDARKAVLRGDEGSSQSDAVGPGEAQQQLSAKGLARQQRREAAMRARGIEPPKPRACDPPCRGWAPESFEYIMLDAPCTGLGLRPRLTQELKLADLEGAAAYQRTLIDTAVALLRPSGRLVYSTCSINPGSAPPGKNASGCLHRCSGLSISWSRVLRLMGALVNATPRLGGPGLRGLGARGLAE
eukprot:jgi/Tetstr1/462183/TSEL_007247.t3